MKLESLNDFVSKLYKSGIKGKEEQALNLIYTYNYFLNLEITEEMFGTVFPDFIKCNQKYAVNNNIVKSFDNFGNNEFSITIYTQYGKDKKYAYVTSYHLKTINDLVGKIDNFNSHYLRTPNF